MCPGSGGWSYPRPNTDEVKGLPPIQLYDLSKDIGERENVQDQYPEVVEELKSLLSSYVKNGRSTPGAGNGAKIGSDESRVHIVPGSAPAST